MSAAVIQLRRRVANENQQPQDQVRAALAEASAAMHRSAKELECEILAAWAQRYRRARGTPP